MATTNINVTSTGYKTVKDESTALPQRNTMAFTGSGVSAFDNGTTTVINIPGYPATINYGLFAQTANSTLITNTNAESSLINGGVGTLTIPANGFQVGVKSASALNILASTVFFQADGCVTTQVEQLPSLKETSPLVL